MWLFFCYTIQLININLCTKFQNPKSSSYCEIFDRKKCLYVLCKSERRKKMKKEGKLRISILISNYTVHFAYLKVYTKFENTGSNRNGEICDRNFHWRERKMNKKGMISNMWLFFCYTIRLINIKLCTKFQNPNSSGC